MKFYTVRTSLGTCRGNHYDSAIRLCASAVQGAHSPFAFMIDEHSNELVSAFYGRSQLTLAFESRSANGIRC